MNTLLHALKPPDIQGYYRVPRSRTTRCPWNAYIPGYYQVKSVVNGAFTTIPVNPCQGKPALVFP